MKACDEKPADFSSIECSSHADVDASMATSSREVKLFGAFVVPVFTCFLSLAAEALSEKELLDYWVGFKEFLSLFKTCKDYYLSQLCAHDDREFHVCDLQKSRGWKKETIFLINPTEFFDFSTSAIFISCSLLQIFFFLNPLFFELN